MQLVDSKKEILIKKGNRGIKKDHSKERGLAVMYKHQQAHRLQMLRKKHQLTTRQLGKKLGVSNGIVSRWCRGDAYPSRKHVRVICEYFDIEPAWLIYGIDDKPQENDLSFVYKSLDTVNQDRVLEIARALLDRQLSEQIKEPVRSCTNGSNGKDKE
mgnify:CR=1 FL=1